eukprot:CAMPEP_0113672704 /NCGR_PEP_ID=MMETSP0038_2-20120614/6420_1 /TAXON_ID=2898 /ORGANISM="Cryptomonas paramecium" /LENGTH=295 /DNA_ID=CAMNT_0000589021 /DNA_START=87 /DNA_END=971 /DNA_ORIENTATION=- /assembly_acc=CAM_ASM_000170
MAATFNRRNEIQKSAMECVLQDNTDVLVLIFCKLCEPRFVNRLRLVSKGFKNAADNDSVWRCLIERTFGPRILNLSIALQSSSDLSRDPSTVNGDSTEGSARLELSTMRLKFRTMVQTLSERFVTEPVSAIENITTGSSIEESGAFAASFIYWCSPKLNGVQDIRTPAIRFLTEPKGSPSRVISKASRKAFVLLFEARGLPLLAALRGFLRRIVMPGEASRVCRILWDFAGHYATENPQGVPPASKFDGQDNDVFVPGLSHDSVYMLIWSLLVLNTDHYNPKVVTKMEREQWVRN